MKIGTAVILAAGLGTRMGQLGATIPKGLIRVGQRPIIEESIIRLISIGIDNVIVVTGHLHEQFTYLGSYFGTVVKLLYNPHYRNRGSMYSLYLTKDLIKADFLLLESDLVYETRALTLLTETPYKNAILLKRPMGLSDELFVEAENGLLKHLSKKKADLGSDIAGVFTGLFRFSAELFYSLITLAEEKFEASPKLAHGTFLKQANHLHDIYCLVEDGILCVEIDDQFHFDIAKKRIYPKILNKDGEKQSN